MRIAAILAVCVSISAIAFSADIYVPDDFGTIQEAIDAAVDGDRVIVRSGTYVGKVDFKGKAITVKSESGPGVTTIDGNRDGSAVIFVNKEGADSVLDGFTVTNGDALGSGGGIKCCNSSPTITNNVISGNNTLEFGGGIWCYYASPTISNNTISSNTAKFGGGISFDQSSPTITGNDITGNTVGCDGGGISCECSSPIVTSNTISGNTADRDGGGIRCYDPSVTNPNNPTISNNTISGNRARYGGGIEDYSSRSTITDNTISDNRADKGGAIYSYDCHSEITDNSIMGNTAAWGGGIYSVDSSEVVTGNSITGNMALWGGGICGSYSFMIITNNNIVDNSVGNAGGGIYFQNSISSSPLISNNAVSRNSCLGSGGGIYCTSNMSPLITNNIISDNTTDWCGGGIYCSDGSPVITNNTISMNRANWDGGAIHCGYSSSPLITNTILWANAAPTDPEIHVYVGGSPTVTYSDVKGGWPGDGNIDADPLFVDSSSGDYHITFDSPCRSAGDRNAQFIPDSDFEGDPRIGLFAFPDIGADEFHTHFYVNGTVSNGSSARGVIIGWPKTNPVMLISGSGVLPTPDFTPFGDFWLLPPWDHRVHFNSMPDTGVLIIDRVVATGLPPGTQVPFQALVGTELSNLWVVEIE